MSPRSARAWQFLAIHEDVESGRPSPSRPGLETPSGGVAAGEARALVVAKLDRLSRSVIDAAQTIEQAQREGWNLVALDLGRDFSTPAGEAMAHMTAVFAGWSGASSASGPGLPLGCAEGPGGAPGRPPELSPRVRRRIVALHRGGAGWSAIAEQLNRDRVATAHGGTRWYPATVRAVVVAAAPGLASGTRSRPPH